MEKIKYLFIDGGYAREIFTRAMTQVYGSGGNITVQQIVHQVQPFRTYIYDCFDEDQGATETDEQYAARIEASETYREQTISLGGVHLREGTLTGKPTARRQRRQKEVDILLAVDMLTHGFNRNMTHAVLLSGDLDFRPVVEALVRGGVFVEVWYEKSTASKELYWAADLGQPLDWHTLYNWSEPSFRLKHPLPRMISGVGPEVPGVLIRSGTYQGQQAQIARLSNSLFVLIAQLSDGVVRLEHQNADVLNHYFSVRFGPIEWK